MIGESFGVKFSDSDTVKSYKELINRFHETSTDTKFSPIIHPPLIRKASLKAAFFLCLRNCCGPHKSILWFQFTKAFASLS